MISKKLLSVSIRENNKRRIWVWIVSLLTMLAFYPGIMTVYLTRIRVFNSVGHFRTVSEFQHALCGAAADALGFKIQAPYIVGMLAALIGIQGFSYLFSRKKTDMYHSVPVPSKIRFFVIYINGIIIYVTAYLVSIILSLGLAAINGALDTRAVIECGLAFVLNLLFFLVVYNAAVLAVMLTGNIIITLGVAAMLLAIDLVIETLLNNMALNLFSTAESIFNHFDIKFCVLWEYIKRVYFWKTEIRLPDIMEEILPFYLKCAVFAGIFGALAYFCYRKRPSEAAGRPISFSVIKPFIKIVLSVTGGIMICNLIYFSVFQYAGGTELKVGNMLLLCGCMVLATLLCCGAIEAIYEYDVRRAIKHPVSTVVSVVIVMAVFGIYYFDVFGYDKYVPAKDKVESTAVHFFYEQSYFEIEDDSISRAVGASDYLEENMFITDVDAVCELVSKGINTDKDKMSDIRHVSVLFRLKSGRTVSRIYPVDFGDESNYGLLDRIIGSNEFREGYYQIYMAENMIENNSWNISYSNGTMNTMLSVDVKELADVWMRDMEQFDFTLARYSRKCGYLEFAVGGWQRTWTLPVYESFENTVEYLKEQDIYVSAKVRPEDVARVTVINYNYGSQDNNVQDDASVYERVQSYNIQNEYVVRKTYDSPEEITAIVSELYPDNLSGGYKWDDNKGYETDYEVIITFKADTKYPYNQGDTNYLYNFISGRVPDFVKEETAYKPE